MVAKNILVSLRLLKGDEVLITGIHSWVRVMLLSVSVVSEIEVLSTDLAQSHLVNVGSLV